MIATDSLCKSSNDLGNTQPSSDFVKIVEALKRQASLGWDLSNTLESLSNSVKRIDEIPEANKDVKEKEPSCLVEYLWAEIWQIERNNRQFEKCINHLRMVIGS
jgi:hypothetical protein